MPGKNAGISAIIPLTQSLAGLNVHLGTTALLKFYFRHRDQESLVLATIHATQGSTYRKPGAMMLISADHEYEGMISGGCLEGDLLQHADEVFASGKPKSVIYDMHAGDELVWGLGLGCDGVIALLLQRLDRDSGFQLWEQMAESLRQTQPLLLALVTQSAAADRVIGTIGMRNRVGHCWGDEELIRQCASAARGAWPQWRQQILPLPDHEILLINVPPQPRILICGAGPDALPVARQFDNLGWQCVVVDHRPAFVRPERFPADCEVRLCRPENLSQLADPAQFDAAVIMSHHLEHDARYLRELTQIGSADPLRYIGVLGPTARRQRLKEMAQCPQQLVYGPVGLDIGAELPESIALSIAAEIHAVLNHRDGQSLTTGPVGVCRL